MSAEQGSKRRETTATLALWESVFSRKFSKQSVTKTVTAAGSVQFDRAGRAFLWYVLFINVYQRSKRSAERRSACAAGFLSFNRASKRSGIRAAEMNSAETSFLVGALQYDRLWQRSKRSAERRSACAAGFLSFNRASKRSGIRAAEMNSAETSFLVGALQYDRLWQRSKRSAERRSACAAGCGLNYEVIAIDSPRLGKKRVDRSSLPSGLPDSTTN